MKKFGKVLVFLLALGGVALAGAIKTWVSGETLTAADLNSNFAHIHNSMVGGHGARLVNADVSASAAISHTKMATPALLPKAWAFVGAAGACGASPCTISASSGVSGVTRGGAGTYSVTLSPARANAVYGVLVTSGTGALYCIGIPASALLVTVVCYDAAGAVTDATFTVQILDDDN